MVVKICSIFFILAGVTFLATALFPARRICQIEKKYCTAWKFLGALVVFFILGYIIFSLTLLHREVQFVEFMVSLILFGGGVFVSLVVHFSMHSIEHMQQTAEEERHRALHDELTDLPNRALLHERIDQAILDAKRNGKPIAVLLMDLDRFKEINDTLGHFYGDYLLQLIAPRLRKCVRQSDTISRLGGDEFAVALPSVGLEKAVTISQKIIKVMVEPFQIEGNPLHVDISIGIALYPQHGQDGDTLLQHADVAMYVAKRQKGNYAVYNAEQDEYSMNRLMLAAALREAIGNNQLVLHYQPKISMASKKVCGVEALIRWRHPNYEELLYPIEFLSIAEETGLIKPMTYWVVDNALAQFNQWRLEGKIIPISVNLSPKNLHDGEFLVQFKELLAKWRVNASDITLEITESSMMIDPARAFRVIEKLRDLGVQLSIDDFGTGYSSLSYLKRLPAGELKIDKSFVLDMINDENDMAIVRATIDLANNMGLNVVAEGVEGKEVFDKLAGLSCDIAQGNYLCPPVAADMVLARVEELEKRW